MVRTITFTSGGMDSATKATDWVENTMNAWLEEELLTKERWLATNTTYSELPDGEFTWHTFTMTITYYTL